MVADTSAELLAWLVEQFGYPGLAAWVAWSARSALQRVGSVAVPVVHRFEPEDRQLLVALVQALSKGEAPEPGGSEP